MVEDDIIVTESLEAQTQVEFTSTDRLSCVDLPASMRERLGQE